MSSTTRPVTPPGFSDAAWSFACDAFEFGDGRSFYAATTPSTVLDGVVEPEDIARAVWVDDSRVDDDEPSIYYVAEMTDGRFVYADAWCDYTGWGCRDGEDYYVGTLEQVVSHMLPEQRAAMGGAS